MREKTNGIRKRFIPVQQGSCVSDCDKQTILRQMFFMFQNKDITCVSDDVHIIERITTGATCIVVISLNTWQYFKSLVIMSINHKILQTAISVAVLPKKNS